MCDKNRILALTTNLQRNYRSEGIVYIDNVNMENYVKPYKRSCSMGKINLKLEELDSLNTSHLEPSDKNNIGLVKNFVHALCQEYLGGIWKQISIDDFEINKPNGGLSNHLFKCEINSFELQAVNNEPTKIFVRLYGECQKNSPSSTIKDIIVSTILSDFSMGPKLYGIFPSGRLEELIEASPMDNGDMFNPDLSARIAEVMAQFHTLEMPFIKKANWLFDTTSNYINQINQHTFTDELDVKRFNKLKSLNLEKEFNDLK